MVGPLAIQVGMMAAEQGVYNGSSVGDVFASAVECFAAEPLTLIPPAQAAPIVHRHVGGPIHSIVARCVHGGPEGSVLDFGIRVAAFGPFSKFEPGQLYRGKLRLSFAVIGDFQSLADHTDRPPLIYDWQVSRVEIPAGGQWIEVERTPRGHDELDKVVLHCTALSDTPRHALKP